MYQERQLIELEEMVKPYLIKISVLQIHLALLIAAFHMEEYTCHNIVLHPHISCFDFFNFLLMTATITTTITMRIITTIPVAIAAIVPPLEAEEPPRISGTKTKRYHTHY